MFLESTPASSVAVKPPQVLKLAGPVTGPVFDAPDEILRTTAGNLAITSASQSTFTATVTATPVPEPGTLTLLGVGLIVSCRKAWQFSRRGQAAGTIQS
jgi:hypothetical protein